MTWLKILINIAKIRKLLESAYLFLNKYNEPKDFVNIEKDIQIVQGWLLKILTIMGSNTEALKEKPIEIASLIKTADDIDLA